MKASKKKSILIQSAVNNNVGILAFPASFSGGFARQISKRFKQPNQPGK